MVDALADPISAWRERGCGIELPHVLATWKVPTPRPPTHRDETRDRLTHITWADDLFSDSQE